MGAASGAAIQTLCADAAKLGPQRGDANALQDVVCPTCASKLAECSSKDAGM
jgi:hypothetical protein